MKHLTTLLICLTISVTSCQTNKNKTSSQHTQVTTPPIEVPLENGMAKAYFASGCFWCVEAVYESVNGVSEVINGYAGGHSENPTYQKSNTGRTGHAEAVEVIYNPTIVSFKTLVDVYFGSQNMTQVNGQGPDRGSQYRSIIFYQNEDQKTIIVQKKEALSSQLNVTVAAEVYPFQKFWIGEDYHQNYERLHPNNSYIRNVSIPRLRKFQNKFPHLLKSTH
ncbi:MAG: Peptide methionine sulfoxide reductase MsrA 2 [Formosa sp. Hel1_33_131]|nr:MAG: Peptide methionine sulfoxide reductase MsrA 2 [Formosa sp. Hel1_33_131]|tara:strand:+ start:8235 stop:8897 length:663 start_codon:yes stop_codon:yes gene_type:complete